MRDQAVEFGATGRRFDLESLLVGLELGAKGGELAEKSRLLGEKIRNFCVSGGRSERAGDVPGLGSCRCAGVLGLDGGSTGSRRGC